MTQPDHLMLIDGDLVPASTSRVFGNINPATEEVFGHAPDASAEDMERAILAARRAFDKTTWSTDHEFRRQCLIQLQQGLQKHAETIRPMLVSEVGAPLATTYRIQLDNAIEYITHYIDLIATYEWDREIPMTEGEQPPNKRIVAHEAVGVIAAITPWNVPLYLNIAKSVAALAAGCTVVLKPAPDTPFCALVMGEIAAQHTDIPAGVFNVVSTNETDVTAMLTSHPAIDAVTLTGSTATGRKVMAAAAPTLKRLTLELGGKSPAILLDDADFSSVAPMLVGGACFHAGQGCAIYTRVLVSEKRQDELVEMLAAMMKMVPWGDPTDPKNVMGPVANARQYESVSRYYEIANQTSRVVLGGQKTERFDKGYWVEPTLITDVDPMSQVPQEEVFGPLLTVLTYKDVDDAIDIANNTIFGLAGGVYSADTDRAVALARRIRSGSIGVNGGASFHFSAPFGGYKQSGLGREWGTEGLEDFLETKTIAYPVAG